VAQLRAQVQAHVKRKRDQVHLVQLRDRGARKIHVKRKQDPALPVQLHDRVRKIHVKQKQDLLPHPVRVKILTTADFVLITQEIRLLTRLLQTTIEVAEAASLHQAGVEAVAEVDLLQAVDQAGREVADLVAVLGVRDGNLT
jgi:hypothetical protein